MVKLEEVLVVSCSPPPRTPLLYSPLFLCPPLPLNMTSYKYCTVQQILYFYTQYMDILGPRHEKFRHLPTYEQEDHANWLKRKK